MSITQAELDKRFNHHPPDSDAVLCHENARAAIKVAAGRIVQLTPECREQSLALTALEEALMWANAAIARHPQP